jgi:hypothetical protein
MTNLFTYTHWVFWFFFWPRCCYLGTSELKSVTIPMSSHIVSARTTHRKHNPSIVAWRRPHEKPLTCQNASLLARYQHWAWRGLHRKHSLIYCVLDRVYRAVVWQRSDEIRYNIYNFSARIRPADRGEPTGTSARSMMIRSLDSNPIHVGRLAAVPTCFSFQREECSHLVTTCFSSAQVVI